MPFRVALLCGATLYLLLALTYLLFAPGLSGAFTFDDKPNLQGLERVAEKPATDRFAHYVLSGVSSTLGRPLSLATFAAQFYSWPHQPSGFLRVNLLLHLLNGILLFWWLVKTTDLMQISRNRAMLLALLTTTIWLIHPLQISTVLYVIQRMAELSATFTLAGLLAYTHGRRLGLQGNVRQGYIWMSVGIGLGLLLGVLSKENAILLPLYVLIVEFTLLRTLERPRNWNAWAFTMLAMPLIALSVYLISKFDGYLLRYTVLDFTLTERLLTESRILIDYLNKLFLPRPSAFGLMFDDYPISRGLYDPVTTLPSLAGILALLSLGLLTAKKSPVLSFGILWFFAAHTLESMFIPLELYFEHRNYVAIVGPLFALVYYTSRLFDQMRARAVRVVLPVGALAFFLLIGFITYRGTALWGSPLLLAATWAVEKPESRRVQYQYANRLAQHGFPEESANNYWNAAKRWKSEAMPLLAIAHMSCYYSIPNVPDNSVITARLRTASTGLNRTMNMLDVLIAAQEDSKCHTVSPDATQAFVQAALDNPLFRRKRLALLLMCARTSLLLGDTRLAVSNLEAAYEIRPQVSVAIELALRHAGFGNFEEAISLLDDAENSDLISRVEKWRHRADVERLRVGIRRLQERTRDNEPR